VETPGRHPVIVVGGGLSGLAAAVDLSEAGFPVTLLEQRPALGGRARSYTDSTTGDEVDNGQHLLIAGYQHTFGFLKRIGSGNMVDVQKNAVLPFHHPERGFVELKLPALPSPAHLGWGILRTPLLSMKDRGNLLIAGLALMRAKAEEEIDLTISQWLDKHRQSAEVRRCFWDPLTMAIMNENADRASAQLFLDALRQAFLGHSRNAALAFPRVGLSSLFAQPARAFIERQGGTVQCQADVRRISLTHGRAAEVLLKNGKALPCSALILAVPASHAIQLVPPGTVPYLEQIAQAAHSPIIGIHLWMNHQFMRQEVVGLIGRRIQWVFRRDRHLSLVISAAREFVGMTDEELTRVAIEDLRSVFGDMVEPPGHVVVIREKRATFSATPKNVQNRPGAATSVPNLFLAGDWTTTGLPATIEGAILSGQRAARLAADSLRLS
jgi:hydroxysqualene dehydroxylase